MNVIGDDAARKDPVEERPRSVRSDYASTTKVFAVLDPVRIQGTTSGA
jgi:hypothetical protein